MNILSRRSVFSGLAVAIAIAALLSVQAQVDAQEGQGPQVYVPYTATIVTKHFDRSGTVGTSVVSQRARRRDGSVVKVKQLINDEASGVRVIVDATARYRVAVDPVTRSRTTYDLPSGELSSILELRRQSCDGQSQDIIEVNGIKARKFRREMHHGKIGGGGASVVDEWLAPDLNCEPLRVEANLVDHDGTLIARNVEEVISVTIGDPVADLFDIPEFPEKSPSQVLAEYDLIKGRQICEDCKQGRGRLDTVYYSSRNQGN